MLLIDIGNHRLKWGVVENGKVRPGEAYEHHGNPTEGLERIDDVDIDAIWISHVLKPDIEAPLAKALGQRFGLKAAFARTRAECEGLHVAYREPERLGVDRWLAMLALWLGHRGAFAVVNAGTALTFDAVDEGGQHRGGLIAPGLVTAQKAILGATRFDVRPQAATYAAGLGQDTESCVRQGALHACAGAVERAARLAPGPQFITGGDAPSLLPHLGRDWQWRPNLVLEGLLALAQLEGGGA